MGHLYDCGFRLEVEVVDIKMMVPDSLGNGGIGASTLVWVISLAWWGVGSF